MTTATEAQVIDRDAILEDIRAVVAEKGSDFIYDPPLPNSSACRYSFDGKPSCLVGLVLARHGITGGQLEDLDSAVPEWCDDSTLWVRNQWGLDFGPGSDLLELAQRRQDDRATYGQVLADVEELFRG